MPGMKYRVDALWRIVGLIYFLTIGWIVLTIAAIAGLLWMVTDIIWQLVVGSEGPPGRSSAAMRFLRRLWDWGHEQLMYVLFGKGTFPIFP